MVVPIQLAAKRGATCPDRREGFGIVVKGLRKGCPPSKARGCPREAREALCASLSLSIHRGDLSKRLNSPEDPKGAKPSWEREAHPSPSQARKLGGKDPPKGGKPRGLRPDHKPFAEGPPKRKSSRRGRGKTIGRSPHANPAPAGITYPLNGTPSWKEERSCFKKNLPDARNFLLETTKGPRPPPPFRRGGRTSLVSRGGAAMWLPRLQVVQTDNGLPFPVGIAHRGATIRGGPGRGRQPCDIPSETSFGDLTIFPNPSRNPRELIVRRFDNSQRKLNYEGLTTFPRSVASKPR
ncbi:hypothetical protein RRG08_015269 [Elysia crispata]|uniref:Uncharacterized protein n=1 Tax=Elysia crispata TaxID=231223 RepID=A0AAE1E481_9GAST|nr:hypothetical protein RRG08_015269 [Elysia crispata]